MKLFVAPSGGQWVHNVVLLLHQMFPLMCRPSFHHCSSVITICMLDIFKQNQFKSHNFLRCSHLIPQQLVLFVR